MALPTTSEGFVAVERRCGTVAPGAARSGCDGALDELCAATVGARAQALSFFHSLAPALLVS